MYTLDEVLKEYSVTSHADFCDDYAPATLIIKAKTDSFDNRMYLMSEATTLRIEAAANITFHPEGYFPEHVVISDVDVLTLQHDFHTKFRTLVIHNVKHVIFTEPDIVDKRTRAGYLTELTIADSAFALPKLVLPLHTNMVDCVIRISNVDIHHMFITTPNKIACCIKIEDMPKLTYVGITNSGYIPHLDIARCPILHGINTNGGKISLITLANMDRIRSLSSDGAIGMVCAHYAPVKCVTGWIHTYVINEPMTPPILPWTNALRLWWELLGNSARIIEKKVSNNLYYCEGYDINNYSHTSSNARMVPLYTVIERTAPPTKP